MSEERTANSLRVADALERYTTGLKEIGAGTYAYALTNGTILSGTARVEDGEWVHLSVRLPATLGQGLCAGDRAWDLLRWNAEISGGGKWALARGRDGRTAVALRAEIPLDEAADLPERVAQAFAGFKAVARHFQEGWDEGRGARDGNETEGNGDRSAASSVPRPPSLAAPGGVDLRQLCTEAGWPFNDRAAGRLAVPLEVADGFCTALLEEDAGGGHRLTAELAACESMSPESRQAIGRLLLRASGALRMARAAAEEANGRAAVRLEVAWASPACAAELGHALAALSVGCGHLCGKEVLALQDERIAREYLAV